VTSSTARRKSRDVRHASRRAANSPVLRFLIDSDQPDGENPSDYYANATTNHYGRIVHATTLDHRGYTFPTMTSPRPAAAISRAPSPAGARAG